MIPLENHEKVLLAEGAWGQGLLFHGRDTSQGADGDAEAQAHTHPWEKAIANVSLVFNNTHDDLPKISISAVATPVRTFPSLQRKVLVCIFTISQDRLHCKSRWLVFVGTFLRNF